MGSRDPVSPQGNEDNLLLQRASLHPGMGCPILLCPALRAPLIAARASQWALRVGHFAVDLWAQHSLSQPRVDTAKMAKMNPTPMTPPRQPLLLDHTSP